MSNTSARVSIRKPVIRYVYLVEDVSDAARMGALPENTYTNAQLAWNAAVAIITANPTYRVVLQVGVTTAAGVGGIIMSTSNSWYLISIVGLSTQLSEIGDITIAGSPTNSGPGLVKNAKIGNIITGGNNLHVQAENATIGDITYPSSGILRFTDSSDAKLGNLTLTGTGAGAAYLELTNSKNLYINSIISTVHTEINVGTIAIPVSSTKANIIIGSVNITGQQRRSLLSFRDVEIIDTFTVTNTATAGGVAGSLILENCKFNGVVALTANSAIPAITLPTTITGCTFASSITCSGARLSLIASTSNFSSITNLSANSVFSNCVFRNPSIASPLINGIGAGCQFYNSTFLGGSVAINNASAVKVLAINSYLQNRVGANIWIYFEDTINSTAVSTNATTITAQTIPVPTNAVFLITANVTARKTAGAGVGVVGDGNGYVRTVKAKNVAGVVTIGAVQSDFTSEDIVPFNVTFTASGTNVLVRVTGLINDTVDWNVTSKIYS